MPGRPRKPSALKVLNGSAAHNPGRVNPNEPVPEAGTPEMDLAHLSPRARDLWPRFADLLLAHGVLTVMDGSALYGLVEAYADLVEARRFLREELGGSPYYETTTKDGDVMHRIHPVMGQIAESDRRVVTWLSKFGLTPADRSRVAAQVAPQEENPFLDI